MKKAFLLIIILTVSVITTACINNLAVQELNLKAKESMEKGDYETAIGRLKSSIDLDDTIFETHYNLGIAYTNAEKYSEATEEFEKALKLNPDSDVVYYSLAVALENQAKDIINPPLKKDDDADEEEVSLTPQDKKELSLEDKQQIVELFEKSISAYNKYIDKTSQNTDDIKSKIEYLQEEVNKYSE